MGSTLVRLANAPTAWSPTVTAWWFKYARIDRHCV
jgi:hypothetical protein